jgi:tetratricopeptide (TPR) repeat protein
MPLPDDRSSLLSLAAETERVLAETANAEDEKVARRHAFSFRRLAVIRWKLGELDEAARLFGEAAAAYFKLDSSVDRETAAATRIEQSTVLMANGRTDEALVVIEGLIGQADGFPEFEELTAKTRRSALNGWQILLEKRNDHTRLYEAAGRALALLDPADPTTDRNILAQTLVTRAKAAEALGHREEAVEPYEQAIALFVAEGSRVDEGQLIDATYKQVQLLSTLDREDELAVAFDRIIALFGQRTEPWAQQLVKAARMWQEEQDGE